ncbi:serine hydrolase domain-containing protein [Aquimarina litoralis]|uniref:serine hydrolase domain-containing protein n=1 Tax=Aquimarina litoralis TaxID=584605 RepID=UPI001C588B4D|nr:serine hydrolase domain-containing protein [Aquimarina litoralis]MBW1297817.1 serine hydrolase [Aquimarina litoralis]
MNIKRSNFLILFLAFSIQAQQKIHNIPNSVSSQIKILAEAFLAQTHTAGISIAISKDEKLIYADGFGYANIEENIKMEPDIRVRTASVAKVITATALGRLASEGKLDFDAPIKTYVPYINEAYAHLTTRQLAGHTAGLEHRPKGNRYKKKQYTSMKETVELMKAPLLFPRDSKYKYSTHAFNLLAAVIEGASGKTYLTYMQEEIFDPLDMSHTKAENINELSTKDAQLYRVKNNQLKKETLTNGSYKIPGASFRSTAIDLVKMINAYSTNFISEAVVAEMFKSHQLLDGTKTNVGIAWRTSIDPFGNKVIEHAGNWLGARTVVAYFPEENLSIALMVNTSCQVLIEETAHIFAQIVREHHKTNSLLSIKNQDIELTFNSNKGSEEFKGTLSFDQKNGLLETTNDNFLKSNPIYYLGSKDHYTLATQYGLLYLSLLEKESLEGNLYTYFNRQSVNPKEEKPIATFKSIR